MSWDEPQAIANRLAVRLGVAASTSPADAAPGGVLLLRLDAAAEPPAAALRAARAAVVAGETDAATSAGLAALRAAVERQGVEVVLATFATTPAGAEVPLVIAAARDDALVGPLLAAGPHALPLDAAVDARPDAALGPAARVCVVSFEVAGMTGGGIGTASTALAETLAAAGHDVTLLFTGWQDADAGARNATWQAHYAERGVRLEILRTPGTGTVRSPHFPARSAYEVYCWLRREEDFDVVHLPENMGHGAYAQAAKLHGSAFAETTFVVGTHGPTRWAAEANRVALTREEFLVNEALERASVARADVLLGPSRYLHDYMRDRSWRLPERVHVQPYARPGAVRAHGPAEAAAGAAPPTEIVLFGRLETRKGVATLCDALDLLAAEGGREQLEVTFLGPVAQVLGEPADTYIAGRATHWPWRWQVVSDRDQQGAAAYLRRPGVLAVMPSLVDNAPNTVSEAVALGIPLVAARAGGTGELVAAEQRDDHTFGGAGPLLPLPLDAIVPASDARPLADLLRRRLSATVPAAAPPVHPEAVDAAYDRWHRAVAAARRAPQRAAPSGGTALPSLAVCVLFDGDDELLAAQLAALGDEAEVVVADVRERPEDPPATAGDDVATVRPQQPGHAAQAREMAVAAMRGELVAVLPPGDVPLPGFVGGLRRAAAATGADVVSCAVLDELGGPREEADAARHAFVPIAGPPVAGLTHPAFAAGPYAMRRDALARLGGFPPDARGDEVDHELLNRAAVAGLTIEVAPEPLAAKRRRDRWTTLRAVWPHVAVEPPYDAEQSLRATRPFADAAVTDDVIGLLVGARADAQRLERELHQQHDVYEARAVELRTWAQSLEAAVAPLREENGRLRAELEETTLSAAQLAMRVARKVARRASR